MVVAASLASLGTLAACATDPTPPPMPTATAAPTSTVQPTLAPTATLAPTVAPELAVAVVSVGAGTFVAEVADNQETRAQGLSGRPSMAPDAAMWFAYGLSRVPSFWMLRMHFPLDIVWVDAELRVVSVTNNLPIPDADAPEASLPRYSPGVPVRYVLEINAGLANELGIVPGSIVTLTEP